MQYIPCNSALLAQETLFLTQKGTVFAQRSPKSAQIATNLNLRQKSVCSGLKFLSESKLFGRCHPCSRATSATLGTIWQTSVEDALSKYFFLLMKGRVGYVYDSYTFATISSFGWGTLSLLHICRILFSSL